MTETSNPLVASDVAAILDQLRAEIRAAHASRHRDAADPSSRALQRSLDDIEITRVVSAHWPLTGRTLPQKAMALLNKVVRRYLRWYINPIVEQQNAFNDATARAVRLLAEAYQELAAQVADIREAGDGAAGQGRDEGPTTPQEQEPERRAQAADGMPPPAEQFSASVPQSVSLLMEEVRRRAATEPDTRFIELELQQSLAQMKLRRQVNAHWPLAGRSPLEKALALHNRVVRQYLRWLINPIVDQQNAANDALAVTLDQLARADAVRRAEVAALRAKHMARRG